MRGSVSLLFALIEGEPSESVRLHVGQRVTCRLGLTGSNVFAPGVILNIDRKDVMPGLGRRITVHLLGRGAPDQAAAPFWERHDTVSPRQARRTRPLAAALFGRRSGGVVRLEPRQPRAARAPRVPRATAREKKAGA